jgi:hypothetical protein
VKTLHDARVRDEILRRLDGVGPASRPLWGRMNVGQMLCHVGAALEMAMGMLPVKPKPRSPLRRFPLKQLVIYVLPWPKGVPTAPELLTTPPAGLDADRARTKELVADSPVVRVGPEHPTFGVLSGRAWSVLQYRHLDHHLRQFGA